MRRLVVITGLVIFLLVPANAQAQLTNSNPWIKKWTRYDSSIYAAIKPAAFIFKASPRTMKTIVGREGGNVNPRKLKVSLCRTWGKGWNVTGNSAAFGPMQFMLDYRGACFNANAWGTFGTWDDAAFRDAKSRGFPVPYRFKHPASNVGQAITTAYMLSHSHTGGIGHWCASMC